MALLWKPETEHGVFCTAYTRRPTLYNLNPEEILNKAHLSFDVDFSYACHHVDKEGVGNRFLDHPHPLPCPVIKAQRRKHEKVAVRGQFRFGFEQTECPSHSQTNQTHLISSSLILMPLTIFRLFASSKPLELSSSSFSSCFVKNGRPRLRNKLIDTKSN